MQRKIIAKYGLYALGALVGAVLGYVYWINWACDTGCPLTETPIRTVLYGAVVGALFFSIFTKKMNK